VKNDFQLKKIYDLRMFAETFLGFPLVLNYTWHEIWRHYSEETYIDWDFWNPHFNYMDFNKWHDYIFEEDNMTKPAKLKAVTNQSIFKVQILDRLRIEFQKERNLISRSSYPSQSNQGGNRLLPENFHDISKIWYLFSKLTGTISSLAAEEFRHTFPDFTIGKLMGAEITDLKSQRIEGPRGGVKYRYTFRIYGLSTNVKINIADLVILVPYELRDYKIVENWRIRIELMNWIGDENCYEIETDSTSIDVFGKFRDILNQEDSIQWYIYPTSGDYWTSKLYNRSNGFLSLRNVGDSWLGQRLSYLWSLRPEKIGPPPNEKQIVDAPEVYLYLPKSLSSIQPINPVHTLFENRNYMPNESQKGAILHAQNSLLSFIQGPPGTGKSQTISTLIDEILRNNKGSVRILVTAFSYQAMIVILDKLNSMDTSAPANQVQKIFLRSSRMEPVNGARDLVRDNQIWKLDGKSRIVTKKSTLLKHISDSFILFANPHQIYHFLQVRDGKRCIPEGFGFDFIICDEASQMPVDQFLAPILLIKKIECKLVFNPEVDEEGKLIDIHNIGIQTSSTFEDMTKIVLVGDLNQLPPVQPVKPPRKLENVLSSIFSYYIQHMNFPSIQLEVNYRSHDLIVEYTRSLAIYTNLKAHPNNAGKLIPGDVEKVDDPLIRDILDPSKVLVSLIHNDQFDTAVSELEAKLTIDLTIGYFKMVSPSSVYKEKEFWRSQIGIVSPHNAQGRVIIRGVHSRLIEENLTHLNSNELMNELRATIFSVEKFQGSDRDCIIGTIGISSNIQLEKEEEFIYELNRFNVLTSRGKSKVVFITSRNYVEYIPRKREVMKHAAKVRKFVKLCTTHKSINFENNDIDMYYRSTQ